MKTSRKQIALFSTFNYSQSPFNPYHSGTGIRYDSISDLGRNLTHWTYTNRTICSINPLSSKKRKGQFYSSLYSMRICYKVQKKQICSSVAWATPCITSQHELLMVLSTILVSKETDLFYTMAHVKATEAFLGLVLKQRKITYSNAGRKICSTELTEKPKLRMINDIKVNFNYLIFASHMWTLTTQIRNCLLSISKFHFSYLQTAFNFRLKPIVNSLINAMLLHRQNT